MRSASYSRNEGEPRDGRMHPGSHGGNGEPASASNPDGKNYGENSFEHHGRQSTNRPVSAIGDVK